MERMGVFLLVLIITVGCSDSVTPSYSTQFNDRAAVLEDWQLSTNCIHCGNGDKHECTQCAADATSFGERGMIHTTRRLDPASSPCGAYSISGHATYNPSVLYGNFSVTARWFPGAAVNVSTATGFIGLDSDGNEASITMGFHGEGWPQSGEGAHKYQHGIYANVKKSHNREYTQTGISLADSLNTFGLLWTPSKVVWSLNGRIVRSFTDTSAIPNIPMRLRLHTRSGYGDQMPNDAEFYAQFTRFEYQPWSPPPPVSILNHARLLYSANFTAPLSVIAEEGLLDSQGKRTRVPTEDWVLESQNGSSQVLQHHGQRGIQMQNNGSHMVLWCNQAFPSNSELRFGVLPRNSSQGLAIVFFGASALDGSSSIFSLSQPPRHGDYDKYYNGSIATYSDSYFRADGKAGSGVCDRDKSGRCVSNLRKDPGFDLVGHGMDLVSHRSPKDGAAFEVAIRRMGASVNVSVDGVNEIEYTDVGPGAPLHGGFIGLRQMANIDSAVYTHFDVYALE